MKIVIAPDSFKGSFTSSQVIERVKLGARKHFGNSDLIGIPIADGGEGTVSAITRSLGGEFYTCNVSDAYGQKIEATYGIAGGVGILEMAEASGLVKVIHQGLKPLVASTYGTGEMIGHALDQGIESLVIGIGGSATNDGGIGMAAALGVRFLDREGHIIDSYGGQRLKDIEEIDLSLLDKRVGQIPVTIICDVSNPLTGDLGASKVYGPQKGATDEQVTQLEEGMCHYRDVLKKTFAIDMDEVAGAGAAGGLGAAIVAYLGGVLKPGVETILDLVHFDEVIKGADLVITGEGCIDGQSVYGKVPVGVAKRCLGTGIQVIAIAGATAEGYEKVYNYGVNGVVATVTSLMDKEAAMKNAKGNLDRAIDNMFRLLSIGRQI